MMTVFSISLAVFVSESGSNGRIPADPCIAPGIKACSDIGMPVISGSHLACSCKHQTIQGIHVCTVFDAI